MSSVLLAVARGLRDWHLDARRVDGQESYLPLRASPGEPGAPQRAAGAVQAAYSRRALAAYNADTNVISELIARQPHTKVVEWIDSLDPNTIYLSVITIGEIRKGIEKLPPSKRRNTVKTWLETDLLLRFHGRILDITADVMLTWGELSGRLETEGKPIAAIDSLIAATALQGMFSLVTRNDSEFQHTGVTIINPWKES